MKVLNGQEALKKQQSHGGCGEPPGRWAKKHRPAQPVVTRGDSPLHDEVVTIPSHSTEEFPNALHEASVTITLNHTACTHTHETDTIRLTKSRTQYSTSSKQNPTARYKRQYNKYQTPSGVYSKTVKEVQQKETINMILVLVTLNRVLTSR